MKNNGDELRSNKVEAVLEQKKSELTGKEKILKFIKGIIPYIIIFFVSA